MQELTKAFQEPSTMKDESHGSLVTFQGASGIVFSVV